MYSANNENIPPDELCILIFLFLFAAAKLIGNLLSSFTIFFIGQTVSHNPQFIQKL